MVDLFNRIIRWSFYTLFLCIPLAFYSNTSELFEFNKLWLTYTLAVIIGASWLSKMILQKQFKIQRTPLDIPILLFLISQIISSLPGISMDPHVSFWGYYTRFNGGLLSLFTYIFLYYAFASNLPFPKFLSKSQKHLESPHLWQDYVKKILQISLIGGAIVALWGLPSHFGYDPTCLLFRGTFDVSCWTVDFQPKVRIFSTLGQPDWLAAYLVALIPIALGFAINVWNKNRSKLYAISYLLLAILFYLDLLYTQARSGFIAIIFALAFLGIYYIVTHRKQFSYKNIFTHWIAIAFLLSAFIFTFFIGSPFSQLDILTFQGLQNKIVSLTHHQKTVVKSTPSPSQQTFVGELGGTDSGTIRLLVWQGAIKAWLAHPIFGTGVETYAFAYYLYRPAAHNMTSEWKYLYNKAHNEYLNYLATTGAVGLLTYLAMIGLFLFTALKTLRKDLQTQDQLLIATLTASYISILTTNFFGFSVVIMNIFLFIFPIFVFILGQKVDKDKALAFPKESTTGDTGGFQWVGLAGVGLIALYLLYYLYTFWSADISYAYGKNLDNAGDYQTAYASLHSAVSTLPSEPVYQDELTLNDAVLAAALYQQKDATAGAQLANEAISVSNNLVTNYPNNVSFWKTRVRVMYTLSQIDPKFLKLALQGILKARSLAPTDALVSYNVALLYGQTGDIPSAISTLEKTIKLKPDYRDAYYALGLYYHQEAVDKNGHVINPAEEQKAVDTLQFILNHISSTDQPVLEALKAWGK